MKSVLPVGAGLQRFAAPTSGLASGLALAVRPAGGAAPDNARRSGPVPVTSRPATGAPGARWSARPTRGARDSRCVTAGCVLRRDAGRRRGGQRPAPVRYRARGRRAAAPPPAARVPITPGRHGTTLPGSSNASPFTSRLALDHRAAAHARGCSRQGRSCSAPQDWRAEGRPGSIWHKSGTPSGSGVVKTDHPCNDVCADQAFDLVSAPGRIRTRDRLLRRQLLCPAELRAPGDKCGRRRSRLGYVRVAVCRDLRPHGKHSLRTRRRRPRLPGPSRSELAFAKATVTSRSPTASSTGDSIGPTAAAPAPLGGWS